MEKQLLVKRAWAEVDLDAIRHNYSLVRQTIPRESKLCCVIKANAYGHGAVTLARLYETLGADFLAVSNLDEALELRYAGITLPILILGYTAPEAVAELYEHNISQCVYSLDYAHALSEKAKEANLVVKVHIKVDTGMGRIGFSLRHQEELSGCVQEIKAAFDDGAFIPEGIFTHFASADEGESGADYTRGQFSLFTSLTEALRDEGLLFAIRHAANSAAIFTYPETALDMVRAGILLYGCVPSELVEKRGLVPSLELKTVISHVKEVAAGESISYGRTFVAEKAMRVATLPIGYADGLWRSAGKRGHCMLVHGRFAPIIGRICMDQCMIDVSEIPDCRVGDTVTVFGGNGEAIDALASRLGTIPYEIMCALGERIPRAYLEDNKIVSIFDRILP